MIATTAVGPVAAADNLPPIAVDDPGTPCGNLSQFGGSWPIPEDWGDFDFGGSCSAIANDRDPDGSIVAWQIDTLPAHGTLVWSPTFPSVFRYTPAADYSTPAGDWISDSFSYHVIDNLGASSNVATYRFWISPINDPPRFLTVPHVVVPMDSGPYDESWLSYVVAGPPNESSQQVHFITTSGETHGSTGDLLSSPVTFTADGRLTFTPAPGQWGYGLITLYLKDDGGLFSPVSPGSLRFPPDDTSDPVTFRIDVVRPNNAPVAADDVATTDEDTAQTIPVVANDSDADGDPLTLSGASGATKGTTAIGADRRSVIYTPRANVNGADSFNYTVSDGFGGSATATVSVTVLPVNDPPRAVDDVVSFPEDSGPHTIGLLANDTDVDGDRLTVTQVGLPAKGSVTLAADGASITYTPDANVNGTDSLTYTITDGNGGSASGTVRVTITPVNDTPVAVDDQVTLAEDAELSLISVLANDTDLDGDALTIVLVTNAANGATGFTADGSAVKYQPNANFNGSDSLTYTVSDGHGGTASATVFVTVTPVNDPPTAGDDGVGTPISIGRGAGAIPVAVLANDSSAPDGPEQLSIVAVTQGSHGAVAIGADGVTLTYDPAGLTTGPDSFTYSISDGNGGTSTATVNVVVGKDQTGPVVTAPVVLPDRPVEGNKIRLTVSWTAEDPESGVQFNQLQIRRDGGDWSDVRLASPTATVGSALVQPGHSYQFRVRATNGASPGSTSAFAVGSVIPI